MYYCTHCGSSNTTVTESGNDDCKMFVGEDTGCSVEGFDFDIIMLKCDVCKETSYVSLVEPTAFTTPRPWE